MIDVKFKYSENEYCKAMRGYYINSNKMKIDGIFLVLLMFYIAFSWSTSDTRLRFLLVTACGLYLIFMIFLLVFVPRMLFRQNSKFKDEYALSITEDGIHFKTVHLNSKLDWNYYKKVWESKQFYYLFYGKKLFTIIPKRSFNTFNQETEFREVVTRKISKIKKYI